MYSFSLHSLNQIQTLDPRLVQICHRAIQKHDFKVDIGFRDKAAQDKAYREGKSKLQFPNSAHNKNPSQAMDLLPFVNGTFIGWGDRGSREENYNIALQWSYFGGIILGVAATLSIPLRWGHDWNGDNNLNEKFVDSPHFELII